MSVETIPALLAVVGIVCTVLVYEAYRKARRESLQRLEDIHRCGRELKIAHREVMDKDRARIRAEIRTVFVNVGIGTYRMDPKTGRAELHFAGTKREREIYRLALLCVADYYVSPSLS